MAQENTAQNADESATTGAPAPSEQGFRGPYERYLIPAVLALQGLHNDANLTLPFEQLFQKLDDQPLPQEQETQLIALRSGALLDILSYFGFSDSIKAEVIGGPMTQDKTLLRALSALSQTRFFMDTYTGPGCLAQVRKLVTIARGIELPDA